MYIHSIHIHCGQFVIVLLHFVADHNHCSYELTSVSSATRMNKIKKNSFSQNLNLKFKNINKAQSSRVSSS